MQPRIVPQSRLYELVPSLREGLIGIGKAVERSGLDRKLIELAKIRASQINGCAFCLKMHTADARRLGESEERIYLLDAWREAPCYTERERAALAWTEAVTPAPRAACRTRFSRRPGRSSATRSSPT